jgi:ligand-binding sensor domain-containing protein
LPGPEINALYFDADQTLWVGTGSYDEANDTGLPGLVRVTDDALTVVGAKGDPFLENDAWVFSIAQDSSGTLWVGTDDHLFRYNGSEWRALHSEDGAPEGTLIEGIAPVDDVLWVVTDYEGLYRLDSIGWYRYGAGAIGSDSMRGMRQTRDGALWILSADGLARLAGDPLEFE